MAAAAQPAPSSDATPARSSLSTALLLALSGGMLDAFAYLNHGRTFAAAMTGNAVLCGVAVLAHDHADSIRHAAPIAAFVLGIWLSRVLQSSLETHATRVGLLAEITGLLALSFLPERAPEIPFVSALAFLAAYQVASFRKVDSYAYNSTFITGNLRDAIIAVHEARNPACRADSLRKTRDLSLVILSFASGAVVGAFLAPRLGNHTLWVVVVPLLLVLLFLLQKPST